MADVNQEIKKRFDLFYETDINVVKCIVAIYEESLELPNKNPGQRVVKLQSEYICLAHDAYSFIRKDYLTFADCKSRLFNVFMSHFVLFEVDEEPQLLDSLILNEKLHTVIHLLEESKAQLKPFYFNDFLKGVLDVVFYELNQKPNGTSKREYYKMRNWQVQKKRECVCLEFSNFRERLIESIENVVDMDKKLDFLRSEKQQLDTLFQSDNHSSPIQFASKVTLLRGILPDWMPDDMNEFQQLFCKFVRGKSFPYALSPQMLLLAHENITRGKISPVPVCCWSLMKYKHWLDNVLEGKIGLKDPPDDDYESLFEQSFEKGLCRSQKLRADFKENFPCGKVSEKKYLAAVWVEVNKLRTELNHLINTNYYQLLINKENVKYHFINQCLLDSDIDYQVCELRKAIVLHEMIKFFKSELFKIDERLINPSLNINDLKNDFADILSSMVPNANINDQILRAFFRTSLDVPVRKPLFFIVEDLKDCIDGIFKQALINLQHVLYTQPGNLIASYAVDRLRILRGQILEARRNGLEMEYLKVLKNLFKAQVEFFNNQQNFKLDNYESPLHEIKIPDFKHDNNKILAFYYNNIKDDKLSLVRKILIDLKAIAPETTLPELRALVNGEEVSHPLKWLAGQGELMVFIREATNNGKLIFPYQQQWNIAVICFVKPDGSKFNAASLKVSLPTNREAKFIKAANAF